MIHKYWNSFKCVCACVDGKEKKKTKEKKKKKEITFCVCVYNCQHLFRLWLKKKRKKKGINKIKKN